MISSYRYPTREDFVDDKRAAKDILQQRLSLKNGNFPIVGVIMRLTHQKGIHLIKHAIWRIIERGAQVVLLGTSPDPRIQREFVDLSNQLHNIHHDCARLCLTCDEPLSHLIYTALHFIRVPLIFEPCGLTQLVAMKYGSIPIVCKLGGGPFFLVTIASNSHASLWHLNEWESEGFIWLL